MIYFLNITLVEKVLNSIESVSKTAPICEYFSDQVWLMASYIYYWIAIIDTSITAYYLSSASFQT